MARTFRLLGTLGEGAFGAVHLAEIRDEEDFVQTLAVKWLHPEWSGNPELTRRLRDEARLLALLHHDHIVRVHGLTRIEDRLAILMEPVDGRDLSEVDNCPPRAALEIIAAVADALDAACHAIPPGLTEPLNVVHRDIKPSNVMVTPRGNVKVMDFGVARASFDTREAETRSQQFGTARYMAPERWLDGVAEAPSDIFSLGVTLMELVSGRAMEQPRLSQEGFKADLGAAVAHLRETPDIQALVTEMCAFDGESRPSASAVQERCRALAEQVEGEGLKAWAASQIRSRDRQPMEPSNRTGTVVVEDGPAASGSETIPLTFLTDEIAAPSSPPPEARSRRWTGLLAVGAMAAVSILFLGQQRAIAPAPSATEASHASPPEPAPAVIPTPATAKAPEAPPERSEPKEPPTETKVPRPEPPPTGVPTETEPEVPRVHVTFTIADGVEVQTADGQRFTGPVKTLKMPQQNNQTITLRADGRQSTCTFYVGNSLTNVKVDADLRC
jgi:serine/threonine-protein kinase